jgi:ATP-dependent helicase HrpA
VVEVGGSTTWAGGRSRYRAGIVEIRYPEALPVSQRRDEILAAMAEHQVVVVAGETGSGKTTQLPKMCLELGRGVDRMIGHTQPRRLAARTVSARIAEELGTEVGGAVGYAVRFTDRVGPDTAIKVMTDGILLAELQRDRELSAYDTLIVDEAHERSLNIDFLLGYLAQLLPRRPDLHVVVTSATIDVDRFSAHFGGAPVIEVSGRTYPVELRYRPLDDGTDQVQGICDAVGELRRLGPGDVLVFLSGEREIRDTAEALGALGMPDTEVVPLYARLPLAEQQRAFAPHAGRRIVLATNVAETSITVPGIRYVVDPGTARISRYSNRLKVQRLPIEPISQASARQRAGRCGRVAPGTCIRLYAEDDLAARPEYTEPEILRTNLASVILQMTAIGLGDIAAFPFLDPPDPRAITDGTRLLEELGALAPGSTERSPRLTRLGRRLARLPVDPRFGRMVLEAEGNGSLAEVLIIASALSIQDPRERPAERAAEADALHARFTVEGSDFLSYLSLWRYARQRQRELSSNQFRKLCKREMLNHLRLREWQDVHGQLRQVAGSLGMSRSGNEATPDHVHQALLAGLLSHVGYREGERRDFLGPRGGRFAIFPGSSLARKPPRWAMAAELVETSRLWGRTVAAIQPEWAEALGDHLVKRTYQDPRWSIRRGQAVATERVTLYGLPLVAGRTVALGPVDPDLARELFVEHALVAGEWDASHPFLEANRALLDEIGDLEARFRRTDLAVGPDVLVALYEARIGPDVTSARHFERWWRQARRDAPDLLTFTSGDLLRGAGDDLVASDFPERWVDGDRSFPVTYRFEPGVPDDGATVHLPVAVLNQLDPAPFSWHVPGLRAELVTALLRGLPKALRRELTPLADVARQVLARLPEGCGPDGEPLTSALARAVAEATGVDVAPEAWDVAGLAPHLRLTFVVRDDAGRILGAGKDLAGLARRLAPQVRTAVAAAAASVERDDVDGWTFGALPRRLEVERAGQRVVGYPALVDEGGRVALRVLERPTHQDRTMWLGVRALLLRTVPVARQALLRPLGDRAKLALATHPYEGIAALLDDCLVAAADTLLDEAGGPPWDAVGFDELVDRARHELADRAVAVTAAVAEVLAAARSVDERLAATTAPVAAEAVDDATAQRRRLVGPGFVAATGAERLADLVRYLVAIERRLDKVAGAPGPDRARAAVVRQLEDELRATSRRLPPGTSHRPEVAQVRWMLEELRVSFFAQALGTPRPVSEKRVRQALAALPGQLAR